MADGHAGVIDMHAKVISWSCAAGIALAMVAGLGWPSKPVDARTFVGIGLNFGFGGGYYRPYYGGFHRPYYGYYGPPVVYAPPPVVYAPPAIVEPPQVVYQTPPIQAQPASPTYQAPSGQYCREYQATQVIGGQPVKSYGTACLQPDGSWRIVN